MGIKCKINRNSSGEVTSVTTEKGTRSKLFDQALKLTKDSQKALDVYTTIYTKKFQEDMLKPELQRYKRETIGAVKNITSKDSIEASFLGQNFTIDPKRIKMRPYLEMEGFPKVEFSYPVNGELVSLGTFDFRELEDGYQIIFSNINTTLDAVVDGKLESIKGKGLGTILYKKVVEENLAAGENIYSDFSYTNEAEGIWNKFDKVGVLDRSELPNVKGDSRPVLKVSATPLDENGEPKLSMVTRYLGARSREGKKLDFNQTQDIKEALAFYPEFREKLINAFIKDGIFIADENSMTASGLYTIPEARAILNNKELRNKVKNTVEGFINTPDSTFGEVRFQTSSTEDSTSEAPRPKTVKTAFRTLTRRLQDTNLAKKTHLLANKGMAEVLRNLGIGENIIEHLNNRNTTGAKEGSISKNNSSNYAYLTEDGNNFVFFHRGKKGYETIEPRSGESSITSREEASAVSKVGGVAMYYTDQNHNERQGDSEATYAVTVPKGRVYDFNSDPLNLIKEARERHQEENPNKAFDPNSQFAYVTKIAGERGFDMVVGEWLKGMPRAQSTKSLKPSDVRETEGNIETKPFEKEYVGNIEKGYEPIVPATREDNLREVYDKIHKERNKSNTYDKLYSLYTDNRKYSQEEITEMIEESDISPELKVEYREALNTKKESRRSEIKEENYDKRPKPGNRLFNEPLKAVEEIANKYYERVFGGKRPEFKGVRKIDKDFAKRLSDAFEAMENNPNDPDVKAAYEAMAKETMDQYKDFRDAGYKIEINNSEPYNSSQGMINDLRDNKKIKIFSTNSGFGDTPITEEQRKENPLLKDSGVKDISGETLLVNDIFRAVHDFYGHAELGNSFGAIGEENAWNIHARMFSPLARRAMTTETRGQNSYVNFSGVNEEAFKLRDEARKLRKQGKEKEAQKLIEEVYEIMSFAEQKLGLLPEEFSSLESTKQEESKAEQTQGFFSDVVSGKSVKYKPFRPYEYEKDFNEKQESFREKYDKKKGEFDEHIATSIPTFRDTQVQKGAAIVETFGGKKGGALMYDIGGSEGGFAKTITEESNGNIKSINLDPNSSMKEAFDRTPVEGATFVLEAFNEGFDNIPAHTPKQKADVVHESMVFQFIKKGRRDFVKEVSDKYLKEDGIFITEEKFKSNDPNEYSENERIKNEEHKSKYFTKEQQRLKGEEVLVGMDENQANFNNYIELLKENFDNVEVYWTSGNFKGVVASNNRDVLDKFLESLGDTSNQYNYEESIKFSVDSLSTPFYSNAVKGIEQITQKAATPAQWVKMIADKGGKGTTQELEWIGLEDFLDSYIKDNNVKSVPKVEVEKYIQDNQISIEEVTKGGMKAQGMTAREAQERIDEGYSVFFYPEDGSSEFQVYEVDELFIDSPERDYYLDGDFEGVQGDAKYSEYTLEGGENYREVLLTLPNNKKSDKEFYNENHWQEANVLAFVRMNERTLPNGERTLFIEEIQSDWAQEGRKKGFSNSDIVEERRKITQELSKITQELAIKREERKDLKNKLENVKSLSSQEVVDIKREISKLKKAQEKVRNNREFDSINSEINKLEERLNEEERIKVELREKLFNITHADNNSISALKDKLYELNKANYEELDSKIPNMPYKKTDQWVGMASRRIMQMAAQEGFDRVTWVTGEQSADRYSLKGQVESITVTNKEDGRFVYLDVMNSLGSDVMLKVDDDGKVIEDRNNLPGEQGFKGKDLSEVVGKEMAEKIMTTTAKPTKEEIKQEDEAIQKEAERLGLNSPNIPQLEKIDTAESRSLIERINKNSRDYLGETVFKGDDLEVGGEGMKTFYNSIVPKVIKKEARRFDKKADIDVVEVPLEESYFNPLTNKLYSKAGFTPETSKQLSIRLTGKLKESLNSPIPLFQLGKSGISVTPKGFVYKDEVYLNEDKMGLDTPIHEFGHLWNKWAKENTPETYNRGIDLIKKQGKEYLDFVRVNQPTLEGEALYEEALAQAIGDRGAKLITQDSKKSFTSWLSELWQMLKNKMGISEASVEEIQEMNLEEFADAVATDLLKGKDLKNKQIFFSEKDSSQTNSIGMYKNTNPYIQEKAVVQELGGIKDRQEFESALEESEFSNLIEQYNSDQDFANNLFEQMSSKTRVREFKLDGENLTRRFKNETAETLEETITPVNNGINEQITFLGNISEDVWSYNAEEVTEILKDVRKKAVGLGVNLNNLEDFYYQTSKDELMDLLDSVKNVNLQPNEVRFKELVDAYDKFYNTSKEVSVRVLNLSNKNEGKSLIYLDTSISEYELFEKHSLIQAGENLYQKVNKEEDLDVLYDLVSDRFNKEQVLSQASKVKGDNINGEEAQKLAIYKMYFDSNYSKEANVDVNIEQINYSNFNGDFNFLSTDFIADFYKEAIREEQKESQIFEEFYSNFEINSKGVTMKNTDPVTIEKVKDYLDSDLIKDSIKDNLKQYSIVSKNFKTTLFNEAESSFRTDEFYRDMYTNNPALAPKVENYTTINQNVIAAKGTPQFISTTKGLYEGIEGAGEVTFYSKLPEADPLYNKMGVEKPELGIDIANYSHLQSIPVSAVRVGTKLTKAEKSKINNEHFECE